MFTKNNVSQSLVDAVKNIIGEASPIKEPTSTGMRVYGRSYGNSAKAKQDQSKSSVDDLKGPKTKELLQKDKEEHEKTKGKYDEAAKPDYLDFDKDGDKKEPMKSALAAKKKVAEELKGDQHKIDANKNNKIDAHDFAILRGKKKVKEDMYFAKKLIEGMKRSDIPASVRKARGDAPLTPAEVKSGSKDSISHKDNLAKARNEEVEQIDELTKDELRIKQEIAADRLQQKMKQQMKDRDNAATKAKTQKNEEVELDERTMTSADKTERERIVKGMKKGLAGFKSRYGKDAKSVMYATATKQAMKEGTEDSSAITTDTLIGRMPGGKSNDFKSYKIRVRPLDKEGEHQPKDSTPIAIQPDDTPARKSHETASSLKLKEGKRPETDDAPPFEQPYTRIPSNVKDKSGAVHTPMSRARDLAKAALKKVRTEMLGKLGTSER